MAGHYSCGGPAAACPARLPRLSGHQQPGKMQNRCEVCKSGLWRECSTGPSTRRSAARQPQLSQHSVQSKEIVAMPGPRPAQPFIFKSEGWRAQRIPPY